METKTISMDAVACKAVTRHSKGGPVAIRLMGRLAVVLGLMSGTLMALGGGNDAAAAANKAPIAIGYIASQTGSLASESANSQYGVAALVNAVNKQGGYRGHPLKLISEDDQSSPAGLQNAVNILLSDHVFAIISSSFLYFLDKQKAQQAGVPVIGFTDGPEWGQQPYTNMFDLDGDIDPNYTGDVGLPSVALYKSLGVKNVGGFAVGIGPSSEQGIIDLKTGLQDVGLKMGYENLSLPIGAFDPTTDVLQMKNTGVDAFTCACTVAQFAQIQSSVHAAGMKNITSVSFVAPDPSVLTNPTSRATLQNAYFVTNLPPTTSSQTQQFESRLHAAFSTYKTGTLPSFSTFEAYLGATYLLQGLQLTGQANPTPQSFMTKLRTVKNWNDNGLLPGPISFNNFGHNNTKYCRWFTQLKGTTYVYVNNGKPFCMTVPANLTSP
jgi:ABC-type branched-subunit amino acid transport system substrate-binding protein